MCMQHCTSVVAMCAAQSDTSPTNPWPRVCFAGIQPHARACNSVLLWTMTDEVVWSHEEDQVLLSTNEAHIKEMSTRYGGWSTSMD